MSKNSGFGALMLAIFIDILGFAIIIPLLPFIVEIIDVSVFASEASALGWITAAYSIVQFIFAPIWGRISDRVGRRPIILIGIFGSSISFIILAFSKTLFWVMFSRGLQGFFTAASLPTARAFIADTTPEKERAKKFGLLGAAFGFGFSFGPLIGGYLSNIILGDLYLYATPALFAASLSIINFVIAYPKLIESLPVEFRGLEAYKTKDSLDTFKKLAKIFKLPGVGSLLIIFGVFNLAFSGFETVFTKFVIDIDSNVEPDNIGLIFGLIGGISIIIQVGFVGPVTKKIGDDNTLILALVFLSTGFFLYIFVVDLTTLIIFTIPIAVGAAFFSPSINSSLSRRIPASEQGGGLGLNSSLGSLGRVFGPLLLTAPFIYTYPGSTLPFIITGVMLFILLIIAVIIAYNRSE